MSGLNDEVLEVVIKAIRDTVDEDWVHDFDIRRDSRFDTDLEIESIEFIRIIEAMQAHYGAQLDVIGWLSGKSIQELIALNVGQLVDYVVGTIAARGRN